MQAEEGVGFGGYWGFEIPDLRREHIWTIKPLNISELPSSCILNRYSSINHLDWYEDSVKDLKNVAQKCLLITGD